MKACILWSYALKKIPAECARNIAAMYCKLDKEADQPELLAASKLVKPFLSWLKTEANTLTQRRA